MGFHRDDNHVRGDLFTDTGKWKYTVELDYTLCDWDDWDLWRQARQAFYNATLNSSSGVVFDKIPKGWTLVVLEPFGRTSHPITVRAES